MVFSLLLLGCNDKLTPIENTQENQPIVGGGCGVTKGVVDNEINIKIIEVISEL